MELFHANKQWATRPDDERFTSLQDLYDATKGYADISVERNEMPLSGVRTEARDGEVGLLGPKGGFARLTNWAFGQVARIAAAPADYLRKLPATLAVQNVNHGLAAAAKDAVVNLLFQANGDLLVRAMTSDRYSRIWNHEVVARLLDLQSRGWVPARPTFNTGLDSDPTDKRTHALYASDHDMFAFICHPDRVIREAGNERGLLRGLIAVNSEVGAAKLRLMRFYYREMCGNHIIWGAEDVTELAVRHVGNIRDRFALWQADIIRYADESTSEDEARVAEAQRKLIGGTKEEVLDALFGKRNLNLSRKQLEASYDAVIPDLDGDPNTKWGFVQGLTRFSQTIPYADGRTAIDAAGGKILAMNF